MNPSFNIRASAALAVVSLTTLSACASNGTLPASQVSPVARTSNALRPALGGREKLIELFNGEDGGQSTANLISDKAGNFYGTATSGGAGNSGAVFELSPRGNGRWKKRVIFSFDGFKGGKTPFAGLTFDTNGNLYGTTADGGNPGCTASTGACGVVFELSSAGGRWKETVLHTFDGADGAYPVSGVTLDKAGDVFGATEQGGGTVTYCGGGCGVAYELTRGTKGKWAESVLHIFNPFQPPDGQFPESRLVFDAKGNLYGTTFEGEGPTSSGCVYELTPAGSGKWTETVLQGFTPGANSNGQFPSGDLVMDSHGDLIGTTSEGGRYVSESGGVIYMLGSGTWRETVLFSFDDISEGLQPQGGVILDDAGNMYGTTEFGGQVGCPNASKGCGNVFEVSKSGTESTVALNPKYGYHPLAGLVRDTKGNLYGTTRDGGNLDECVGYGGCGSVFEVPR